MTLRTASGNVVLASMLPERSEQQRPAENSEIVATAPSNACSAQHDDGDRGKQIRTCPMSKYACAVKPASSQPDQRCAEAAQGRTHQPTTAPVLTPESRATHSSL
jgi:hypothetical protein